MNQGRQIPKEFPLFLRLHGSNGFLNCFQRHKLTIYDLKTQINDQMKPSMKRRLLFFLAAFSLSAPLQASSTFLDSSRAIDWTVNVGFTIPTSYTNCSTQPTLTPNSTGAASANGAAIQNALNACTSNQVVNIPAGTYYVAGFTFGSGHQVLRGAGPISTTLIFTSTYNCEFPSGICMMDSGFTGLDNPALQPPNGPQQCSWTAGFAQGTTVITLSSCGSPPPSDRMLVLDQVNDAGGDTGGIYLCDSGIAGCTIEGSVDPSCQTSSCNKSGRTVPQNTPANNHSQQQVVRPTSVVDNGDDTYSVTIPPPGILANNFRAGMNAGALWANTASIVNTGVENLTMDTAQISDSAGMEMVDCYQCWVKNVRMMHLPSNGIKLFMSANDVIRDSYFYQAQRLGSESYGILPYTSSNLLIENNIFQQLANPILIGQASGSVFAYNFSLDDTIGGPWIGPSYYNHNAGSHMNLWEGNAFQGIWGDNSWGTSNVGTFFRNMLTGWNDTAGTGLAKATTPIMFMYGARGFNVVGNVLGQPGFHTVYETYATSTSGGVGQSNGNVTIYQLGWVNSTYDGNNSTCNATPPIACDTLVRPTLMRWGNYDVATAGNRWDSTEASPGAFPYLNANFTSSYFNSLAHTLPASLYYNSKPSWWPSGKAWPPIGPDVSSGNLGTCVGGTYGGFPSHVSRPMHRGNSFGCAVGLSCHLNPGAGLLSERDAGPS